GGSFLRRLQCGSPLGLRHRGGATATPDRGTCLAESQRPRPETDDGAYERWLRQKNGARAARPGEREEGEQGCSRERYVGSREPYRDSGSRKKSAGRRHKDDRPERARAADERAVLKTLPSWFSGRNSFQSIASLRTQPFTSRVRCPGHIDTGQLHRGVCRRGGEEDI